MHENIVPALIWCILLQEQLTEWFILEENQFPSPYIFLTLDEKENIELAKEPDLEKHNEVHY